jgi:hypothetical protein
MAEKIGPKHGSGRRDFGEGTTLVVPLNRESESHCSA